MTPKWSASPSVAMPMSHFPSRTEILEGGNVAAGGAGKLAAEKRIVAFMDKLSTSHLA